jgi:cytoskeletal protein CcmA (bactofilin family)
MSTPNPTNTPAPVAGPADQMTVIGADTKIKGEMYFEKSARILGQFEGKIGAKGEVQVGASALCKAAIEAERVIVDGAVSGPIHARDRLTLTANARVQGDLTAGTLVVAEGASFVGHCNVGPRAKELAGGEVARQNTATNQPLRTNSYAPTYNEPKPAAPAFAAADDDFRPPWASLPPSQPAA